MAEDTSIWNRKGATLSDKTAREEFGLSQEEIYAAVRAGKLQYRENNIYGNPYLRLLRQEVEAFVAKQRGRGQLERAKLESELKRVNRDLKKLKGEIKKLELRKAELTRLLE
jgi:hypothetical protein